MADHERRFDPSRYHVLVDPQRQARWDPPRFLRDLGVKAGQVVLDLGCGPGFWTLPLAELVGSTGEVWALDVSPEMLAVLQAHCPPAHVRAVQAELPDVPLADARMDLVWVAFVFHEVEPPRRLAEELRRVTRPGGRVLVLDWRPDGKSSGGPPRSHRLWPDQVVGWLREAGFAQAEPIREYADDYLILAR